MHSIDNKLIKGKVPFLRGRTVLYVGTPAGTWVDSAPEWVADRLRQAGYSFLYLPELLGQLSLVVLQYLVPGLDGTPTASTLYQHIGNNAGLDNDFGFLYKRGRKTYLHTLPEDPDGLDEFLDELLVPPSEPGALVSRKAKPIRQKETEDLFSDGNLNFSKMAEEQAPYETACPYMESTEAAPEIEEPLDDRTRAILTAWKAIEDKYGITIKDLEVLLGTPVKLSRLLITCTGRIYLADWEGRPEIQLDDVSKTLYFFYLRHPEGLAFKDLQDYEDEMYQIYEKFTGRDDPAGMRRTIQRLADPFSESRNPCVSRIKRAFKNIVEDRIAQHYYIDGRHADKRFVRIDRDMVIWEH